MPQEQDWNHFLHWKDGRQKFMGRNLASTTSQRQCLFLPILVIPQLPRGDVKSNG